MSLSVKKERWAVGQLVVDAIWLGVLVGISFLATPAKFLAPSLSLPVALDVGRHTFLVFNKAEWILSVTLLALLLSGARSWISVIGMVVAAALLVVETAWLLPLLDSRAALIIAGQQPEPSKLHALYIGGEAVKLVGLLLIMIGAARCAIGNDQHAASGSLHREAGSAAR